AGARLRRAGLAQRRGRLVRAARIATAIRRHAQRADRSRRHAPRYRTGARGFRALAVATCRQPRVAARVRTRHGGPAVAARRTAPGRRGTSRHDRRVARRAALAVARPRGGDESARPRPCMNRRAAVAAALAAAAVAALVLPLAFGGETAWLALTAFP